MIFNKKLFKLLKLFPFFWQQVDKVGVLFGGKGRKIVCIACPMCSVSRGAARKTASSD